MRVRRTIEAFKKGGARDCCNSPETASESPVSFGSLERAEAWQPQIPLELFLRVINVSLETMEIVLLG
jgi:hypothetical protein